MSKEKIKSEINKVLENFSDQALEELLKFLKQLEAKDSDAFFKSDDLHKVLTEDQQLLQKLAQ